MSSLGTDTSLPRDIEERPGLAPAKAMALVVLFGLLAYANSINTAFVFDDLYWIVQNPRIGEPIEYILGWGNRWLIAVTLLLNYRFGGLEPASYHAFNLAVHVSAALTVFGVIRRTLLLPRWVGRFDTNATGLALACALIWMLHPLQTQSVTYVVQRCESLMGLFYLLTVYCALRAFVAETGAWKWCVFAVAACSLGMISKEVMVTAPVMVVVFDWVFLALPWREQLRRRWALYAGLACTTFLLTPAFLGALPTTDADVSVGFGIKAITPMSYAMTQPGVILHYLRLTFWPDALCLDYWDWPTAEAWSDWLPQSLAVLLLVAGSAIGLCRRSWLGFLGAWFFGILALTSSFLPIADKAFEHRMYLPLLSPVIVSIVAIDALLSRLLGRSGRTKHVIGVAMAFAVVVLLTAGTIRRNADYSSVERMWRDVIAKRPANPRGHVSLGAALLDAGRLDEAAEAFRITLQLRHGEPTAHNNLGVIFAKQGKLTEAMGHFRAAIASRPTYASAHHQLGIALLRQEQHAAAVESLQRAVDLEPSRGEYRFARAFALSATGLQDAADRERRLALTQDPGWPQRTAQRAWRLGTQEPRHKAALQEALLAARQAAFANDNSDAETLYILAVCWAANGAAADAKRAALLAERRARDQGDPELAAHLTTRFSLRSQD